MMNDSSDEDDLEALRLEALKSLKPRNDANATLQASSSSADINLDGKSHCQNQSRYNQNDRFSSSKQSHEHPPSHRNSSFRRRGSSEDRSHHRHEVEKKSNPHLDSHSSSKLDYRSSRPFDKSLSFRERPLSKQHVDSSRRNVSSFRRKFDDSRRQSYKSIDRRRNSRLRRSYSSDGPSRSNSNTSPQKYPADYRNSKSDLPSNRRNLKSSQRLKRDFNRRPSPKTGTVEACDNGKSADILSSLPLCAPKHYVELFYGKKLAASNLNDLSDSNLVIDDEDRALLSEKSNSENKNVQLTPSKLPENTAELNDSNEEMVSPSRSLASDKDVFSQQVKRIEESLRRRCLSPKLTRSRDRIRNERLMLSRPRRIVRERNYRDLRDAKHDDASLSDGIASGLITLERDQLEGKMNKSQVDTDETLDPVLEARRKKFESNDTVKVVPKRIKLTNQPAKQDSIQTDDSDLRNLLIAKHRGRLMSAALCIKENIESEDRSNMSASSPLSNFSNFEDGSISAQIDKNASNSSSKIDYLSPVVNSELVGHSEIGQVKVKTEVETDNDQILNVQPLENLSMVENVECPSTSLNMHSTNEPEKYLASELDSNTEKIPVFESADYTASISIKKELVFSDPERSLEGVEGSAGITEKPFIDEPDLIPQQPDNPEDSVSSAPVIKIKPLTELLDRKVLKKAKKSKKKEEKSSKKRKKKSKSKDKDRENHPSKLSKRSSKLLSQSVLTKEAFPTRIVRSALAEALGKKKRKVFESTSEAVIRTTSLEQHPSKDHRKVLILDEAIEEKSPEESSPSSKAPSEVGTDDLLEEDLDDDSLRFQLSSKAPLYSSKKSKKRTDIYKMIQLKEIE